MRMEKMRRDQSPEIDVEFQKGCPLCEHSDPELERDLQAFAQLLFDVFLSRHQNSAQLGTLHGIDKEQPEPTVKERSNKPINTN